MTDEWKLGHTAKEETGTETAPLVVRSQSTDCEKRIICLLKEFPLERSTPMECLSFINELKKQLYQQ